MDNLDKEFVPYQIALDMKSIGFDEPCFGLFENGKIGYNFSTSQGIVTPIVYRTNSKFVKNILSKNDCTAPTYSQSFRFFRKKGYDVNVKKESIGLYFGFYWTGAAWVIVGEGKTYEEAELETIKKLIEIVKNNELYECGNNPVRG
jgi:hypothetical protein